MPITRQRSGSLGGGDGSGRGSWCILYGSRRKVQLAVGLRKCKEDAGCGASCTATAALGHSVQAGLVDTAISIIK